MINGNSDGNSNKTLSSRDIIHGYDVSVYKVPSYMFSGPLLSNLKPKQNYILPTIFTNIVAMQYSKSNEMYMQDIQLYVHNSITNMLMQKTDIFEKFSYMNINFGLRKIFLLGIDVNLQDVIINISLFVSNKKKP